MKRGFGFRAKTLFFLFFLEAGKDFPTKISERCDQRAEFVGLAGSEDFQFAMVTPEQNLLAHDARLTIKMHRSGFEGYSKMRT